jgi:hypothetical protein
MTLHTLIKVKLFYVGESSFTFLLTSQFGWQGAKCRTKPCCTARNAGMRGYGYR